MNSLKFYKMFIFISIIEPSKIKNKNSKKQKINNCDH